MRRDEMGFVFGCDMRFILGEQFLVFFVSDPPIARGGVVFET